MRTAAVLVAITSAYLLLSTTPRAQAPIPARGSRLALYGGLPAVDGGVRLSSVPSELSSAPDDQGPYEPGRLIVKFRQTTSALAAQTAARSLGASLAARPSYANFDLLDLADGDDPEEVARLLMARFDVEYAQPLYRSNFHFVPNDPLYASQWNFPAIDMERAWDINRGASNQVTVAVIDSGIAFENVVMRYNTLPIPVIFPNGAFGFVNHGVIDVPFAAAPDLIGPERIVAPYDFVWNDRHPLDTLGHGTHVAGTIGQLTDNRLGGAGMAFNVRLMPVKVAGGSWDRYLGAVGWQFTDDQVARSIRYAADNGAKAMNMSFGRTGQPAPVVEDAVRYAVSRGAFCVFSAGNSASLGSPYEVLADIATRVDGVVAVGAVGPTLNRALYSSSGSWVELSAPGGDVAAGRGMTGAILQQTLDTALFATPFVPPRFDSVVYQYSQGTSMAAPHVTGFAALLYQQGITNPAAIEAAMKRYATDRGATGRDNEYGAGIINPRATLRGLGLAK